MLLSSLQCHAVGVPLPVLGCGLSDDSAGHLPEQRLTPTCKNAEKRATVIHVTSKRLAFPNYNVGVEIARRLQSPERDGFTSSYKQATGLMYSRFDFINRLLYEPEK